MPGTQPRWLRVSGESIVARGEGVVVADGDERVVAVVPAADVTLHQIALPDLSEPQALAAARLTIADQSAAPAGSLHVAVGRARLDGERTAVAVDRGLMAGLLADLAVQGFDPDAVIAAPMLLARPETGFVRGDFGSEVIVRGPDSGFVDDPLLTPLLTGGDVTTLDLEALERGLVDATTEPEVDLRQGVFAKRRTWAIDWARLRFIGRLAAVLAIATLAFAIVQLIRLNGTADRLEANSMTIAAAALPPGTNINNPLIQVQEQLNALRGPGGGLLPLAAGVAGAAEATTNLELTSLVFDGGGTLRVTARALSPTDLTLFETKLAGAGLAAAPGPALVDQGRQVRDYTVSVR